METLILASLLYLGAFSLDYLHFLWKQEDYRYVSRETYLIFMSFGIATLLLFHVELGNFFQYAWKEELAFILFGYLALLGCCWGLLRDGESICATMRRVEHCISYRYVFVKSKEILLQQLLYLVIAMELYRALDTRFYATLAFIAIISLLQIPQLLHVERFWLRVFVFLTPFLGVIYFNSFMEIGHFWPVLYLNVLVFMFIWVVFSDRYTKRNKSIGDKRVDKGIKDNVF